MNTIKLRHYARGRAEKTCYRFRLKRDAILFAEGYQRALLDLCRADVYVSVHDQNGDKIHDCRG